MAKISTLTELTSATDSMVLVINDGTPSTKSITVANLKASLGLPSRALYANLNQSGTDAPTMTVIKNTLGYTPTFLYDGVGDYTMLFNESIDPTNTVLTSGFTRFPYITEIRLSGGGVSIQTYNRSSGSADAVLVNASIKLEIYE